MAGTDGLKARLRDELLDMTGGDVDLDEVCWADALGLCPADVLGERCDAVGAEAALLGWLALRAFGDAADLGPVRSVAGEGRHTPLRDLLDRLRPQNRL